jgi:hypothetical protein
LIYLLKNGDFDSYVNVYQTVPSYLQAVRRSAWDDALLAACAGDSQRRWGNSDLTVK